jgi:hypothetical protein
MIRAQEDKSTDRRSFAMTSARSPESIDREAEVLRLRLRELRAEKRLAALRVERREVERTPLAMSRGGEVSRGNDK